MLERARVEQPVAVWRWQGVCEPYLSDPALIHELRARFASCGYVKLPGLLAPAVLEQVCRDARRLRADRVRRDFVMPGCMTERRMSVLGGRQVVPRAPAIAKLYADPVLRGCLSSIVDAQVHTALHDEEFVVINCLDGEHDTHGWHLDDPRYALVIVVDGPSDMSGGRLEYIPHWRRAAAEHGFDPLADVAAGVGVCRRSGRCRSEHLRSGDCYLLDAAESLHRVSPLAPRQTRMALNLAFDDRRYRRYGASARQLYG